MSIVYVLHYNWRNFHSLHCSENQFWASFGPLNSLDLHYESGLHDCTANGETVKAASCQNLKSLARMPLT